MPCPKCKKGFITEQQNLEEDRNTFGDVVITSQYDRYYKFCSNVLCNWKKERRELKSKRTWDIKKEKYL